jgi:hypothetical protein
VHRIDRAGGISLQRLDLAGDLLGGPWVCTASALTSEATTAKPRPAAPARAASMVELSARSVVCLAICAIRLTTLPIAADDSRRRSTLRLASRAAALA